MRALANFIMAGRLQAVAVAAVSVVAALLSPPFSSPLGYLGGGAVALTTLRRGLMEGISVILLSAVAAGGLAQLLFGHWAPVLVATAMLWLPVAMLSYILRRAISLSLSVQVAGMIGLGIFGLVYLLAADPAGWWQRSLGETVGPMLEQHGAEIDSERLLRRAAALMTGLVTAAYVVGITLSLLLGRAWQAALYNPGGFRREFHALRLSPGLAGLAVALALASRLSAGIWGEIATQATIVVMTPFVFGGLALLHCAVARFQASVGWLAAVYVLLFIIAPQAAAVIAIAGLLDAWFNLRARLPGTDTSA